VSGHYAIGIDLGGTQVRTALIDVDGKILKRASEPTRAKDGADVVIDQIVRLAACVSDDLRQAELAGAGVSSPGPLDTTTGVALGIPTIAGFASYPMREEIARRLSLPVALENDGIAAAIGEWKFGAGRGRDNLVYVTVSTGIGGGVIADGRVLRGRRGMAGHVGHMSFVQDGEPCVCGGRGCFEAYGSGTALAQRARAAALDDPSSSLNAVRLELSSEDVFAAAAKGDRLAQALVRREADILGRGFAALLHLYSPEVLVMGGGLSSQFGTLEAGIIQTMRAHAMPAFRDTPVMPAELGSNSGLAGAAVLAFERVRQAGRP
jgi:glucokinase